MSVTMEARPDHQHYAIFAPIFRYPEEKLEYYTEKLLGPVARSFPERARCVMDIIESQRTLSLGQQQEYYLRTFDVQAVCCLYIGYLLFGDDEKRARVLVNLQDEHRRTGVDCRGELADHLPNVLELLAKTPDNDFAEELGYIFLIPVVKFMLVRMKNIDNYYKICLEVLLDFLHADFRGENLQDFAIPDQMVQGKKEFIFPSSKVFPCELGSKQKSF
jgi:nitrate reductase molybdenum cofactor assembly chaperone